MEDLKYISTRGEKKYLSASEAILKGIAGDGGLLVPEKLPVLEKDLSFLINLNYKDLAFEILKIFYTDFTEEELKFCINNAYDDKFDTNLIAPLLKVDDDYFLELFHGSTSAFKDMALSLLPYLLTTSAKKNKIDKKIIVLTATSGDTGKAALEGFKNVENTKVVTFYPIDGVSNIQKLQMTTTDGNNTYAFGIYGNFDDAQNGVKNIFTDKEINEKLNEKGYILSSANSINIGRLFPQVVYYFYAYSQMVKNGEISLGEKINFTVPTGNFGNILAGYYAKLLGLPINKLICASNDNKVLYDFFNTKIYDKNREFIITSSPSMDILISSNLERLIFLLSNDKNTKELYSQFNEKGKYFFDKELDDFYGEFTKNNEALEAINEVFKKGYVMDTHTAVAYKAFKKYQSKTNDNTKTIIISTASPYKFVEDVCFAIDKKYKNQSDFVLFKELEKISTTNTPKQIKELENKPILHDKIFKKEEMIQAIYNIL